MAINASRRPVQLSSEKLQIGESYRLVEAYFCRG